MTTNNNEQLESRNDARELTIDELDAVAGGFLGQLWAALGEKAQYEIAHQVCLPD
jgi:hypothetical protein